MVEGESPECVNFAVRLWDDSPNVIVEVQRSCGCSFQFHQLAKCVLRCSKGLTSEPPSPPRFTIPKCVPRDTPEQQKACLQEGLELAADLLQKDAIDAQLLGVESLVHLTKACKAPAADSIVNNEEIRTTLLSLIQDSANTNNLSQRSISELEENNLTSMRRQAMTVLANCLDSLKEQNKLHACLDRHQVFLEDALLVTLVHQVAAAQDLPHEACQAVRCLGRLTEASGVCRRRALELGAPAVLHKAFETGQRRHLQLQGLVSQLQLADL